MTAIPSEIQQVLDLFQQRLSRVTFGDLETAVLGRAAEDVQSAAAALAEAESAADRARAALTAKQDELAQKAQRALAYARIYAEADTELAAQVDAIVLPRATRGIAGDDGGTLAAAPLARRRGRPPKNDVNGSLLVERPAPANDPSGTSIV